jgi:hypothetical protein
VGRRVTVDDDRTHRLLSPVRVVSNLWSLDEAVPDRHMKAPSHSSGSDDVWPRGEERPVVQERFSPEAQAEAGTEEASSSFVGQERSPIASSPPRKSCRLLVVVKCPRRAGWDSNPRLPD